MPRAVSKIFSVTIVIDPSAGSANATAAPGARVSPVGLETLAALARPGSQTHRALAGYGAVAYRENRAASGRITHLEFDRAEDILCDHVNPSILFPRKPTRRVHAVPPDWGFPRGSAGARCARPARLARLQKTPGRRSAAACGLRGKPCHLSPHYPFRFQ